MLKKSYALLIIILAVGIFFRFWKLSDNPQGFFVDEASAGYNAYKILTTGKDAHDKPFPLIFQAVGDYRDPVMIYSTVPFIWLFGLSEFSVRVTSAVYGIAGVVMMYLLASTAFNRNTGIWAGALFAISPWHVHFSRVGFQLIAAVFWMLFALYFLYKSEKHIKYYFLAALGFILAFFSYSTTKMYIIPILIFFAFTHWKLLIHLSKNKYFWIANLLALSGVIVLIYPYVEDGTFFKRWDQVYVDLKLSEYVKAYLNHFSLDFLFIKGDAGFHGQDVTRHSIHGIGELYYFQLPFLIISAIYFVIAPKLRQKLMFWFLFLLLYPLGSIFSSVNPQATRSILGVIPFTILTAVGIDITFAQIESKNFKSILYSALGCIFVISTVVFAIALRNSPLTSSGYMGWQYGYKEAISYFKQNEAEYDQLILSHRYNMGHELIKFYNVEYNCLKCTTMNNPIQINPEYKQLFAARQEDLNEAVKLYPEYKFYQKRRILLPNGQPELFIGTFIRYDDR